MGSTKIQASIPGVEPYDIRVGQGAIDSLGTHMRAVPALSQVHRVLVITDDIVEPLYFARAEASLKAAGLRVDRITVPAGEGSKTPEVAAEIWEACASLGLDRQCAIVALGGGVVGDLAGFVASTYLRGIPLVQVPTTLLAMVDSSVGGKTGLNLEAGKNLAGSFWHPSYVCASTDVLQTLPGEQWASGLSEAAKTALVTSDDMFFWFDDNADALRAHDIDAVSRAIVKCVVAKVNLVAADPQDTTGCRAALNYGHTLGHALEAVAGYGTFSHGRAVAAGMGFAASIAQQVVGMSPELAKAQGELLSRLGVVPVDARPYPAAALLAAMHHDKKSTQGGVRMVLLADIGDVRVIDVPDMTLRAALAKS